jgi:hypothetical protein
MLYNTKKEYILAIGTISLVLAIFLDKFAGSSAIIDLISGLFSGLSLTMNLAYLFKFRAEKVPKII